MARIERYTPTGDSHQAFSVIKTALQRANLYHGNAEELYGKIDFDTRGEVRYKESPVAINAFIDYVTGPLRPGYYIEIGVGPEPRIMPRVYTPRSPYRAFDGAFVPADILESNRWRVDEHSRMGPLHDERVAVTLTNKLQEVNNGNRNITVELGDGRSLSAIPDGSAQEVFMGNVLLAPGTTIPTIIDLFENAKKKLNPETGVLVIGEDELHSPTEELLLLNILLDRAGYESCLVHHNSIGEVSHVLGWPYSPNESENLRRNMGAVFIIAKPTIENSAAAEPRRGVWSRLRRS